MSKNIITTFKVFISKLFQSQQEKRHSKVGSRKLWKQARDFQFQFLTNQGLLKTDKLLDIGCGTLRGGIPLINYLNEGNYFGIDVRDEILEEGRKEIKTAKLDFKNPTLMSFNHFSELRLKVKFDVMFAFSVLIHFDDLIAEACFSFVSKSLVNGGVFYANVNIADYADGKWEQFPIVFRTEKFYIDLAKKNGMETHIMGNLLSLGLVTGKKMDRQQIMFKFTKN